MNVTHVNSIEIIFIIIVYSLIALPNQNKVGPRRAKK